LRAQQIGRMKGQTALPRGYRCIGLAAQQFGIPQSQPGRSPIGHQFDHLPEQIGRTFAVAFFQQSLAVDKAAIGQQIAGIETRDGRGQKRISHHSLTCCEKRAQ
jgi:hypothetical protein